jgi:hypothetical protein
MRSHFVLTLVHKRLIKKGTSSVPLYNEILETPNPNRCWLLVPQILCKISQADNEASPLSISHTSGRGKGK